MHLNLSGFSQASLVNGPGLRAVVWVQGCPLGCPGCFNQHTHTDDAKMLITVNEVAERILSLSDIEGVTYSGGEPFEQAAGLAQLSYLVKQSGLSVMSFSGYTIEEIRESGEPAKLDLLEQLDILVDGRFMVDRRAPLKWRGSANQRVHFLSEHHRKWQAYIDEPLREVELNVNPDGKVLISGFLNARDAIQWTLALKELGIHVQPDIP